MDARVEEEWKGARDALVEVVPEASLQHEPEARSLTQDGELSTGVEARRQQGVATEP